VGTGSRRVRHIPPLLPMTANKGASETRHAILREMANLEKSKDTWTTRWIKLEAYIKGMAGRASRKRGGLGRK